MSRRGAIVETKDRLVCNLCDYEINNRKGMLLHIKHSHPDKNLEIPKIPECNFKCAFCRKIYSREEREIHHKRCKYRVKLATKNKI